MTPECRKPKKVKKEKAYLELEAKYEAPIRKQQGKAYIAEGKSWDDSDNDDDEEVGNYALMDLEQEESSSLKKASTEVVSRLSKANEKLESEKQKSELLLVELETVKNASQLVGQYHEKNKPCANIAIGLDYDALNNNKKVEGDKGKTTVNEDVPAMLKKVDAPLFKACEVNFSEDELIIKQELSNEDNEKKCTETTPTSKAEKKPMVNQITKKSIKEVKFENAGKKKKIEMGSEPRLGACKYNEATTNDPYSFCDKFDCIPCNMKVMTSCHKMRIDLKKVKVETSAIKENGKVKKVIWIIDSGCLRLYDSDSEDEAEVNTNHIMNEESTEQVNHENESSSQTPEFDSTNLGRERGEVSASHANGEENTENSSQQTLTRKWDRGHTREAIFDDPTF
ncbi:hypothetical protein AgCh_013558 [Apium graveolens]